MQYEERGREAKRYITYQIVHHHTLRRTCFSSNLNETRMKLCTLLLLETDPLELIEVTPYQIKSRLMCFMYTELPLPSIPPRLLIEW